MKIMMESTDRKGLMGIYNDSISQLAVDLHSVCGILYCCVESVVFAHTNTLLKAETGISRKDFDFEPSVGSSLENVNDDFVQEVKKSEPADVFPPAQIFSPDLEFIKLQTTGNQGIFQCLLNKPPDLLSRGESFLPRDDRNIVVVDVDDKIQKTLARMADTQGKKKGNKNSSSNAVRRLSEEGLIEFEKNAICRTQIYRFLKERTLPLKPALTAVERGIKETELLSFSSLSTADLYRSNQLQEIDEMVLSVIKPLPNFTGTLLSANSGSGEDGSLLRRRFFRDLSGLLFAQILSNELSMEPTVVQRYYPLTDNLLYSLNWPPLNRRIGKSTWIRPSFNFQLPPSASTVQAPPSVPLSSARSHQSHPSSANLKKQAIHKEANKQEASLNPVSNNIETVTLTPAGKSLVFIKKFGSTGEVWLSVFANGSLLGLRRAPPSASDALLFSSKSEQDIKSTATAPSTARQGHADNTGKDQTQHHLDHAIAEDDSTIGSINDHPSTASAAQLLSPSSPLGCFFCHTEDDIRILAFPGPSPSPVRKPDKLGTVCIVVTYPHGLAVNTCSNGTIKVEIPAPPSVPLRNKATLLEPLIHEVSRVIGAEGTTLRNLVVTASDGSLCPYSKDIIAADGTRTLVRALSSGGRVLTDNLESDSLLSDSVDEAAVKMQLLPEFHRELLAGAPPDWRQVF